MNVRRDEDEDADWDGGADDEPAVPCPYCRREILTDSRRRGFLTGAIR